VRASDIVLTVTEQERQVLREIEPTARVEVVPTIHEAPARPEPPLSTRQGLMLIGHYLHAPNVDAALHFGSAILPLVRRQAPGTRFLVVGSSPTPELRALASDGIVVTGHVPDAAPYFDASRVFVAPLRFGAGIKGKICQSLSLGLPVVTTSVGAEGMGLVHGETALIADDPQAFAEQVLRLCRDDDLWRALAAAGKRYVEQRYARAIVARTIAGVLAPARVRAEGRCCR
jgi:hypothetical protein